MSGGVDSSVAAVLLLKEGYDVTGMYAVNYDANKNDANKNDANLRMKCESTNDTNVSCWRGDYQDALRVAAKLGIPLLRWDFVKEYKKFVLDYMYKEYSAGRTPNPDVLCNKFVKFGVWLERAKKEGFTKLATGHYARLGREIPNSKFQISNKYQISNIKYRLCQAKDTNKDQTYFLHQLNQDQLSRVLFPLGDYTKPEVRKLAKKFDLPTAEKEESMGICFIGEVPMKEFLKARITQKKGKITLSDGTVVGEHDGLAFYTIGQRIGLHCHPERTQTAVVGESRDPFTMHLTSQRKGIPPLAPLGRNDNVADKQPLFVVDKDIKHNRLVVGHEDDSLLYKKQISVINAHWINGEAPKMPLKCEARLRHRQTLQKCVVETQNFASLRIEFDKPQRAPTPGQFAVIYKEGECLGGGVIEN